MYGLNWITSWFNVVLIQWFNLDYSVVVVKTLLSISPFVTKVPFVALKSILSNYFCIKTCFKLLFHKLQFVHIVLYFSLCYTLCTLFCHFLRDIFSKKICWFWVNVRFFWQNKAHIYITQFVEIWIFRNKNWSKFLYKSR